MQNYDLTQNRGVKLLKGARVLKTIFQNGLCVWEHNIGIACSYIQDES